MRLAAAVLAEFVSLLTLVSCSWRHISGSLLCRQLRAMELLPIHIKLPPQRAVSRPTAPYAARTPTQRGREWAGVQPGKVAELRMHALAHALARV